MPCFFALGHAHRYHSGSVRYSKRLSNGPFARPVGRPCATIFQPYSTIFQPYSTIFQPYYTIFQPYYTILQSYY